MASYKLIPYTVMMDDVTSGYNIATSLTLDPDFNMMLGFSETEVREMTTISATTSARATASIGWMR